MNIWIKLHPDKFPRRQAWKLQWFARSLYDIDHIYFRIHGHWPTNLSGEVISLKETDFCKEKQ